MLRGRWIVVAGAIVMATLVSTSGVAGATSAANYAKTYCATVQPWRIQIAKGEGAFHAASAATSDLATAKGAMATFLRAQEKVADAAGSKLEGASGPDVKGGAAFQRAVVKNLRAFRDRI